VASWPGGSQADDIKGLSVLLASDAADWITGAAIPDGGNLAMNAGGGRGTDHGDMEWA
jgi:hypothetical protein